MSRAYKVRPATAEQVAELRRLGYQKVSLIYSKEEADRILTRLREEVPLMSHQQRKEAMQATAWEKGKNLIHLGYEIEAHPTEPYSYIVTRPFGAAVKTASGDLVSAYIVKLGADPEQDECTCDYGNAPGVILPCCHVWGVRRFVGEVKS